MMHLRNDSVAQKRCEKGRKGESVDEKMFPEFGYYLDESDSDIVTLRRQDGSFVAAFSARGATRESIGEAAKEDYFELIEVHTDSLNLRENNDQHSNSAT
jgi:hypothetical protein